MQKEMNIFNPEIESVKNLLFDTTKELKNIIFALNSTNVEKYGLPESLAILCKDLSNISNINFNFQCYNFDFKMTHFSEINIYRIAQEALSNILKHSQASEAFLQLYTMEQKLYLQIEDDGKGFDVEKILITEKTKKSFGLRNMEERTKIMDGLFQIETNLNMGTEILIELPLKNTDEFTND